MALDFADILTENKDLIFVHSDKYRAFNLLKNASAFVDNEGIGLDIAAMVNQGLDDNQIEGMITKYLIDFGCNLHGTQIQSEKGNININYEF